ncbi:hypothetical protein Ancab_012745 [Ancistrocladus abbreviatus]
MDAEEAEVKGVVVITLPPVDDPSLGKTITLYTLSSCPQPQREPPNQLQLHHQNHQNDPQNPVPIHPPQSNPPFQFSASNFIFGTTKRALSFLGITLLASVILWHSLFPQSLFEELRNREEDQGSTTFILPLYPKSGFHDKLNSDIEIKFERFVKAEDGGGRVSKVSKVGSTASRLGASSVWSVKGDVYPDGLYFTYLLVGNPPRPYFLDIDTGSDLTWLQCDAPCTSCAKGPHPLYKPTRSKIVASVDSMCTEVQRNQKTSYCDTCKQCDYEIEYADHSSTIGVLARDELDVLSSNGSFVKLNIVFGCAYDQQGSLLSSLAKTDGILGLGSGKVSLPSQLASQGIINNVLGHCLTTDAGGGGYLFLGDELIPYGDMAWAPMLGTSYLNLYSAEMLRISYGSRQINLDGGLGRVLFDSGSSYTYFPKQAYTDLVISLKEVSTAELTQDSSDPTLPLCWRSRSLVRSIADIKHFFKPLTLQFRNKWWLLSTKLQILPESYLILSNTGNVCLGILDGSHVHDGSVIVLGDISMRGHLVVYDNVNGKIGWAQSDCRTPRINKRVPRFVGMDLSI